MSSNKKFLVSLFLSISIFIVSNGIILAASQTIYETSSVETITSGVTLINVQRFTYDGWLNISMLKVSLANPYIRIDTAINKESLNKLSSVMSLAKNNGAVAAVNSSFFNPTGKGTGYVDGPMVKDGKVITAYGEYNRYSDSMSSFSIDKLGKLLYNYWKTDMKITTGAGKSIEVTQLNKPSRNQYNDVSVFDKSWGAHATEGVSYNDLTQVVVTDGKIKQLSSSLPGAVIPQNGYVIVGRSSLANYISSNNIKLGDKITFDISTSPDWKSLRMSTTGSAMLLINGNISFNISGRNPRTAVGSSEDGKTLFMVTVDGRQPASYGMTQYEMAELLKNSGAYNALNLDGGGSTAMVARHLGETDLNTVNKPTETRSVAADLAVFTTAPSTSLKGITIKSKDPNVFVNTPISLSVSGYDKYFNPVTIEASNIKWSVSGVKGKFKDGAFTPSTIGKAKITATVGTVTTIINISSISKPVEYLFDRNLITSGKPFTLVGKNKDGYHASVDSTRVDLGKAAVLKYVDPSQRKVSYKKTSSTLRLTVLPKSVDSAKMDVISKTYSVDESMSLGDVKAYSVKDLKNTKFINIDASKGGIRATDPTEWSRLLSEIKNVKQRNVFVFLNGSLDRFSDRLEAKLFQDVLTKLKGSSNKNVWVVYSSDVNSSYMENGVKYITLDAANPGYLLATYAKGALTFEFKK